MKNLMLALGVLLIGSSMVSAEGSQKAAITKQAMLANKKAIVAQNLTLTPDEETVFWPAYDEYQIGLNKINDEYAALIQKFGINYQNMTDELAIDLVDRFFKLEKELLNYRKDGVEKFRKLISAKNVTRFVQIENKLASTMRAELAQQLPLAK